MFSLHFFFKFAEYAAALQEVSKKFKHAATLTLPTSDSETAPGTAAKSTEDSSTAAPAASLSPLQIMQDMEVERKILANALLSNVLLLLLT